MNVSDLTALVTALTALAIAIGGALTAAKALREMRVNTDLTVTSNALTKKVHTQLNGAKQAADAYQQKLILALQDAGVPIPADESLKAGTDEGETVRQGDTPRT